jgi:glycosyltransferase involved in cell wall biosynthesis
MTPLISIILPVYNGQQYLPEFFERLSNQTNSQFELVTINDGSTDETLEMLQEFAAKLKFPVTIHTQTNQGTYAGMNKGIELASGKWLYFTGCDDRLFDSEVIADVVKVLETNGEKHILFGDVILLSNGIRYKGDTDLEQLMYSCNICHQAIFYRRDVFDKVGYYNQRYKIWADWEFNIRAFQRPDILTQYFPRIIAVYNDLSGISAVEDPIYRRYLPLCLKSDYEKELATIRTSRAYRLGRFLFGWLD